MTALERFKILTGITDNSQDGLISVLLEDAADTVCDYIGRNSVPDRLVSAQVGLAVIAYNRQGTEGSGSRSEGGVSESYIDGLPDDMKQRLKNYPRKVGVLRCESSQDGS